MPPLTVEAIRALARQGGAITLHHGTDLMSAADIEQNGLDIARAQGHGGAGDFWATDDVAEANWFAQVNPAGGQPSRLDFELPAGALLQLLSAVPPQAELHHNDGIEFFSTSFPIMNSQMNNGQVVIVT